MVYQEVHRLKEMGFSNSKIAKKLNISRNRVIDYLEMTPDQFAEFIASLQNRTKKLDPRRRPLGTAGGGKLSSAGLAAGEAECDVNS